MAFDKVTYNIVSNIAVIGRRTDYYGQEWTKEINLVSWNGKEPKIDIREWDKDHAKMSRGITLTKEEAESLTMALHNHFRERSE